MPPTPLGTCRAVALSPDTARWWVTGGPAVPNPEEAEAHIRDFLLGGHPGELVAAVEGGQAIARGQWAPVGSCGRALFAVGFRPGLEAEAERRAASVLARHAVASASGAPGVRYLEMDVPDDAPLPACWREALEAAGVGAIAETHTYALAGPREGGPTGGPTLVPVERLSLEVVTAVYAAAYADTPDRGHALMPEPFVVRLERLTQIQLLSPDRRFWCVAFEGERPVGLVLASMEQAPYGRPDTGWIVEVGLVPEARGRGLSRHLLAAGVGRLATLGATRVLSRIDVANAASIALHSRAGFTRQPGASWMHRALF